MNTVALQPSIWAASATPCAWFPALAATTPRARSASVSREIRTYAPRILNDPVRCMFSHLRYTGPPTSSDRWRDCSSGVTTATSRSSSRAARISSTVTGCTRQVCQTPCRLTSCNRFSIACSAGRKIAYSSGKPPTVQVSARFPGQLMPCSHLPCRWSFLTLRDPCVNLWACPAQNGPDTREGFFMALSAPERISSYAGVEEPGRPRLSLVVPFHNVEEFLDECLASLPAQPMPDLQVLMVDDGSTDGSALIAAAHAGRDPRFVLLRQEQQGPGKARNTALEQARGRFLAFVAGDDVVPPHAYRLMLHSLELTGA